MKVHPAALALPDMADADFDHLKQDIATHGLLCPIELLGGEIIDGRHRWRACKDLGIDCESVEITLADQSPAEYVWSLNGARRHLTPSQRAAVAVDLLPELKEEGKRRMSAGGKGCTKVDNHHDSLQDAAELVHIGRTYVSDAETLKKEAPEVFDQVKSGTVNLSQAKKQRKKAEKAAEDEKAAATAKRSIRKSDDNGVYCGDSFELGKSLPDECCALIFTDPPYARGSLADFARLGMLASKLLVEGGALITYGGQYILREILDYVAPNWETLEDLNESSIIGLIRDWRDDSGMQIVPEMSFFWPLCCLHTGDTAQMREYGIKVKWKPMLWFVKGEFRRDRETWVEDLIVSQQEKDIHPWQQSVIEARYFVEKLTKKGELVGDPFCGGGTTALAAKQLGRQWWTADMDPTCVETARRRLNDSNL